MITDQSSKGFTTRCTDCSRGSCKAKTKSAIAEVPIPEEAVIHGAKTPFTAYCALKDLFRTANQELMLVDPYLEDRVFHRHLRDVGLTVKVGLVTSEPKSKSHKVDRERYERFLEISRLYATERGPDNYRLVVNNELHDRYVYVDGNIYVLGGSVKDAAVAKNFTLSTMESARANREKVLSLAESGRELFGPNHPEHE